mgnify:CR=1 FL=1
MTTHIIDKNGSSIEQSDITSKPSDRHFRNAWTLSGKVISEDMAAARVIFKEKVRMFLQIKFQLIAFHRKINYRF